MLAASEEAKENDELLDESRIRGALGLRMRARQARDFQKADAIRDALRAKGVDIEDTPRGVRWKRG